MVLKFRTDCQFGLSRGRLAGDSVTKLAIADSALSLPSGFEYTATVDDNDDYFCIQDSDTYVWQPSTAVSDELSYWSVTDRDP